MQFRLRDRAGFTLVEIMIVVGVIALLAALALPGMLRARKRAQASRVKDDLRLIEAAVDQYAIETQRQPGWVVSVPDWTAYLKKETLLCTTGRDVLGHDFGAQTVDQIPTVPPGTVRPACRCRRRRILGAIYPIEGTRPKIRFDGTQACQPVRPVGFATR